MVRISGADDYKLELSTEDKPDSVRFASIR